MRKLNLLAAIVFIVATIISCEKGGDIQPNSADGKKAAKMTITENTASSPVSENGITPYLIPGENNGGNRTCDEVATAFNTSFAMCGDKIDYDSDNGFYGEFPEGLNVTVDGAYVSFEMDGCLSVDGKNYKVGAVIVKGSNQANVYYYPDGTAGDAGLAAPVNNSGNPAGLSNLTFCFVECTVPEDMIIAVKAFYRAGANYYNAGSYSAASSEGEYIYSTNWCRYLGINHYPGTTAFNMRDQYYHTEIGLVSIEIVSEGLSVTVKLKEDGQLDKTYLFVGTLDELHATDVDGCPEYEGSGWMFKDNDANSVTFIVPL